MNKTCSKCGKMRRRSSFHLDKKNKDGLKTYCKSCVCKYMRAYWRKDIEKSRKDRRRRAEKNRFLEALQQSNSVAKRLGYMPCIATVGELEAAFNGRCHLCGTPEIECNQKLHLDHRHNDDGGFRGFLCASCNKGLG